MADQENKTPVAAVAPGTERSPPGSPAASEAPAAKKAKTSTDSEAETSETAPAAGSETVASSAPQAQEPPALSAALTQAINEPLDQEADIAVVCAWNARCLNE